MQKHPHYQYGADVFILNYYSVQKMGALTNAAESISKTFAMNSKNSQKIYPQGTFLERRGTDDGTGWLV
ncbi:MAG: hypothetical protein ACOX78_00115 [Lachnospiraceae bacterium]|jgi:hypothetical protein